MENKEQREFTTDSWDIHYTLEECVELFAIAISDDISEGKKRTKEIQQDCKILDSLSNALKAIKM